MTPIKALWFPTDMGVIGVVMVRDRGEIYYKLGIAQGMHEQIDINKIAALGAKISLEVGDIWFGIGEKK